MLVELVEADGFTAGCAVQFDGKRQQTKSEMSLPNGAGHMFSRDMSVGAMKAQKAVHYNLTNRLCH